MLLNLEQEFIFAASTEGGMLCEGLISNLFSHGTSNGTRSSVPIELPEWLGLEQDVFVRTMCFGALATFRFQYTGLLATFRLPVSHPAFKWKATSTSRRK